MVRTVDWPTRDVLADRQAATPEATALLDGRNGRSLSYDALGDRADAVVDDFRQIAGDAEGSIAVTEPESIARIGTLTAARIDFVAVLFAAWRSGNALVPLDPRRPTEDLRDLAARADLDLLVCEADTEAQAVRVAESPVASLDGSDRSNVRRIRPDDRGDVGSRESALLSRDREALVLFTSGTTGRPKGVRLTYGNLLANATASAFRLGLDPEDRWYAPLPVCHLGGLGPIVRSAFYGTTVMLDREFDRDRAAEAMRTHDVTGVSLVPTQLRRLLDAGWSPPPSLRFVLLGGAPADADLVERCEERGVPVHPTYGTTETASQVATARPETAFEHPKTVGPPLVSLDVSIVSGGERVPAGETGEIVVDGPTVTPGYLSDDVPDAFGDLGYHTGDLGYRDEAGRVYVVGRIDDAVQTGGELVHPGRVRTVLLDYPTVADAAVVGVPDDEWGERVVALVAAPDREDTDDIRAHCRGRLASHEVPKEIGVTGELPRTASGTVDREAVRARFE